MFHALWHRSIRAIPKREASTALYRVRAAGLNEPVSRALEFVNSYTNPRLGRRPSRILKKLIPKLLRDHQPTRAAVHDANPDAAELWEQDIRAMAG